MTAAARFAGPKPHPVRQMREEIWRTENREAIAAHNRRVAESGPLLVPDWVDDGGAL